MAYTVSVYSPMRRTEILYIPGACAVKIPVVGSYAVPILATTLSYFIGPSGRGSVYVVEAVKATNLPVSLSVINKNNVKC